MNGVIPNDCSPNVCVSVVFVVISVIGSAVVIISVSKVNVALSRNIMIMFPSVGSMLQVCVQLFANVLFSMLSTITYMLSFGVWR